MPKLRLPKLDLLHVLLFVLLLFAAAVISVGYTLHFRFIENLKTQCCLYCGAQDVYAKSYRKLEKMLKGQSVTDDYKAKHFFTGRTPLDKAIGVGHEPVIETDDQRAYYEDWQVQKDKQLRQLYADIKEYREKHPELFIEADQKRGGGGVIISALTKLYANTGN
ncbi:MAG: hypothetical protein LBT46_15405 [Planctomycetaceae bacterium]|jgi:hypothetical protein|nr:hypothetical protein [Planctomycetaceae bacterium]